MLHAETLHAPFGTLVLTRPSPSIHDDTLKYTSGRQWSETLQLARVYSIARISLLWCFCRLNLLRYNGSLVRLRPGLGHAALSSFHSRRQDAVRIAGVRRCSWRVSLSHPKHSKLNTLIHERRTRPDRLFTKPGLEEIIPGYPHKNPLHISPCLLLGYLRG
jgi:hypothetical protein